MKDFLEKKGFLFLILMVVFLKNNRDKWILIEIIWDK